MMNDQARIRPGRIDAIDVARGVALMAMASYHFAWDLEFFGYLAPGTSGTGVLKYYARAIASSFLFLVGVSLVLAHANGIRWRPFARRLAMVTAAALAITAATLLATPRSFVFFGILHHIALASVLGLLFLRWPWWAIVAAAVAIQIVTPLVQAPQFANLAFYWTGLSSLPPISNDFVPVLPWFSAVLFGMAAAKLVFHRSRTPAVLTAEGWQADSRPTRLLALCGRWSLTFYLAHQPVLIGLVYALSLLAPPDQTAQFVPACIRSCEVAHDAQSCAAYCACARAELDAAGRLAPLMLDPARAQTDLETADILAQCAIAVDLQAEQEP